MKQSKPDARLTAVLAFLSLFIGLLTLSRIGYEALFPRWLWLGRPLPVLLLTLPLAIYLSRHFSSLAPLLPLLLNLFWLFDPAVDLTRSRFLFAASLWLTAVLFKTKNEKRKTHFPLITAALLPVYLLTMSHSVGRADTFEFQVVAPRLGIAHPTGYPLYLLLGKLFTLIPLDSVAWRLNFASAVYAILAAGFLFSFTRKLTGQTLPALLTAVLFGLTPTFWSQAIGAEVYALHILIVAAALWLIQLTMNNEQLTIGNSQFTIHNSQFIIHYFLFFLLGLGLANHLTTLFLLPPAALALFFTWRKLHNSQFTIHNEQLTINKQQNRPSFTIHNSQFTIHYSLFLPLAFLSPLLLYAYLPLRWQAVNGEPMGLRRFVDWVIGGRFQDALQWRAWLVDATRYEIVGRLFLDNWGWFNLAIAAIGLLYLLRRRRQMALILSLVWLSYTFYCLNYYVPDLSVFLLPAQLVTAVFWAAGAAALAALITFTIHKRPSVAHNLTIHYFLPLLLFLPGLLTAVATWKQVDRSADDGLTAWGQAVLAQPLAENAAILADSEKIAPLYYLQQAEGMRPDLEIMVLPDEAAYRAELDRRVAAGQTVYLARFLPGLEGIYHLRSAGPLTEVSTEPLTTLPQTAVPALIPFPGVTLIGYEIEPEASVDPAQTAVTLYWRKNNQQSTVNNQQVYLRWEGERATPGQYPANNYYPFAAWVEGEIVPDFHPLPWPLINETTRLNLQVALGPPFVAADSLNWQTVTAVWGRENIPIRPNHILRAQVGRLALTGIQAPGQIRPSDPLAVQVAGFGEDTRYLTIWLKPIYRETPVQFGGFPQTDPFQKRIVVDTNVSPGVYSLFATDAVFASRCGMAGGTCILPSSYCGWFARGTPSCSLAQIEISGVPLPDGAVNFEDKIALLDIDLPQTTLQPGGQLPLTLTWLSLAPISQDYTVFVQILDANDRLVGQIDAWPVQGTHPTSQWQPGETVRDPYVVQLDGDLPPGEYRLQAGWYLLGTLRRLPVLNADGLPVDDKVIQAGLMVK